MNIELSTGQRLAYDRYGDARALAVVLLHGLSSSRRAWAPVVEHLRPWIDDGRFQVFAVDQRGHGQSSHATLDTYLATSYADDAAALIDTLIGGPALVIGHSLGSVVAASLAVNHPTAVRAMLLGDPPYFEGDDAVRNASPVAEFFPKVVAAALALQARNAPASDYEVLLPPGLDASERASVAETMRGWDPMTMQSAVEGRFWHGFDPLAVLPVPHTIVRADAACGAVFTPRDAAKVQATNPHARIVELTGASHLILAPGSRAAFLQEVDTFLAQRR